VLLSHGDFAHMGLLPLLCRRLGRPLRIICTQPVLKTAMMALYDLCIGLGRTDSASCVDSEDRRYMFSLDDVDRCFSDVQLVKYHQQLTLRGTSGEEIQLCAVNAGRTVGGTAWELVTGASKVFYAVGLNFKKETVLNGADLTLFPQSPSLLIVDSDFPADSSYMRYFISTFNSLYDSHDDDGEGFELLAFILFRKKKDTKSGQEALIMTVKEALRSGAGGNILIPCESGGRALELIQLLVRHIMKDKSRLETDMLIYLSPMAGNIIDFARSQLEWMSDSLCDSFYKGKENPFDFEGLDGRKGKELLKCISSVLHIICLLHTVHFSQLMCFYRWKSLID